MQYDSRPLTTETLSKREIEKIFLNVIKGIYKHCTENVIVNDKKLKMFLLRSGVRH